MTKKSRIIYTKTDEAPALATHSLLPIIQAFTSPSGIEVETRDISLAGRVLAKFPDFLSEEQKASDDLRELGDMAKTPEANIIKLPNISASVPQLKDVIQELQQKGFAIPDFPDEPKTKAEEDIRSRYEKVTGSAVNPVLREGNSDRRAPKAVKNYAKKHPHSMGKWDSDSKTHVATMKTGDFYSNEKSVTVEKAQKIKIKHIDLHGKEKFLKENIEVKDGEIIDATFMNKNSLLDFLHAQIKDAKEKNILFSLHLKATMMKVSDPIIFGHAVNAYFGEVIARHQESLKKAGANVNNGLGDVLKSLEALPEFKRKEIESELLQRLQEGPDIAMVDSDRGITNLHFPNDVIIDASMPAMIRNSGQMWDKDGKTRDTKAVIPDSSYAGIYQATIDFCKENGAFDPTTMGTVPNIGLMAQKAEEYGSHDKTFEISENGKIQVIDSDNDILIEHTVAKGDIWRMCQAKHEAVKDWVNLAVKRAKATGTPAVFWLDNERAHDQQIIQKVKSFLKEHDTSDIELKIMSPVDATNYTLKRVKEGKDTISVTGNVLRDYLTDLFPILELGTSAKMLSIVPLMKGGGLFETGAGGSAPKHVQQFLKENHLRWDSLGEFLALAVSLEHLAETYNNDKARVLSETLDKATESYLENDKSPSRKAGELDNRGSHFYLALYWAQELADQNTDESLKKTFSKVSSALKESEKEIIKELTEVQGRSLDIDGYYYPNPEFADRAMRPSKTFNTILREIK